MPDLVYLRYCRNRLHHCQSDLPQFTMKVYLLKYLATWLADNNKDIINLIVSAINSADNRFEKGPEKLQFVRTAAVSYLTGKAGWVVDTIIHLLLAWTRKS